MGDTFGKGSSCQEAASAGACTKKTIRKMCCNMCKIADKLGNTANGGGAAITDDGTAFNPWAKDGCFDAPLKDMEKKFGKAASCGHAVAMGQCNAGKTIKKMCCASCSGVSNDGAKMNGGTKWNGGSKNVSEKEASSCPKCSCNKDAKPEKSNGKCVDMSDTAFKTHYHKLYQTWSKVLSQRSTRRAARMQ
jgi:hypothetical protein